MELWKELVKLAESEEDRCEEISGILMTTDQMQRDLLNYDLLGYISNKSK
ncbi:MULTISPECIES: hypothetical protein [Methanobacterium]|uniref:Uncharacterized protein n=1 Tax=Methanobacterium veterum TaxID=408577 RepID=A0A9E5DLH1_9EURY|nr:MULTISPECIES: hypothetical protein [Methanobacterium]MCZ3367263.1 hypothetical protein [Methanobacterium veterum]MCZ3373589.1 hypothetical protein [Methanobacterium veterum]